MYSLYGIDIYFTTGPVTQEIHQYLRPVSGGQPLLEHPFEIRERAGPDPHPIPALEALDRTVGFAQDGQALLEEGDHAVGDDRGLAAKTDDFSLGNNIAS